MKNAKRLRSVKKRISGASVSVVVMLVEAHGVASVWMKDD
jgi:hypothetical protein